MIHITELRTWTDEQLVNALIQHNHLGSAESIRKVLHERLTMLEIGTLYEYIKATSSSGSKAQPNGGEASIIDLTDRQLLTEIVAIATSNPEIIKTLPNPKLREVCETAAYQYNDAEGDDFLSAPARRLHRWCLRLLREKT